ncbi:MAG: PhzF family phenazine biosynthesis protein [Spirochaetales bacterium]|nr:PhzF family phenazine biosynthesis protein [Spirochaetales bacterium]
MSKECIFVDVFTSGAYAGNQLAVFPDADDMPPEQMQKIANEINYSETTFIQTSTDKSADFRLRIFTPRAEIPFAGHPTIGSAYVVSEYLKRWKTGQDTLRLETTAGIIPLIKRNGIIWMEQNKPEFHTTYSDRERIAELLGLTRRDISDTLPMQEVSTGNKILIVPAVSLGAVQAAYGNAVRLDEFTRQTGCLAPYIFTTETLDARASVHTRFFAPHFGILEDPATGSAAGPLTAYLLKYDVFGSSFEIMNEQGIEMKRPSEIQMNGILESGDYTVRIGGSCAYVGRGEFIV